MTSFFIRIRIKSKRSDHGVDRDRFRLPAVCVAVDAFLREWFPVSATSVKAGPQPPAAIAFCFHRRAVAFDLESGNGSKQFAGTILKVNPFQSRIGAMSVRIEFKIVLYAG